jgi:ribosomal protein S18 acetylase RimI-like enzyme
MRPDDADAFTVELRVVIRRCREQDLPALEWFGLFAPQRTLIREVFAAHERGEAVMLVAQVNGEASGQAWVDLHRGDGGGAAELWAVRVMPCLQGCGIGTRLVAAAERVARAAGCTTMELAVETDNPRARRLYECLGYAGRGTTIATPRPGAPPRDHLQWLLVKDLRAMAREMGSVP